MALSRRQRERMRALCDELHEDDGVDPREFFKSPRNRSKQDRKSKQLCRQVQKTLDLAFSGGSGDDILNGLRVLSICPAADSSRLLVTVAADVPPDQFDQTEIEARLAAIQGRLRCEVAAAITRRKTPVLIFQVVGPDIGDSGAGESER